jgi:energy-coupling factor transporter ATP-binding protein EcfA2
MRLIGIQLRDFRAFPGNFELPLKDGCNLLLHGENGSGKSSLALALREFFTLDRPFPRPIEPSANVFANPAQPMVKLTFNSVGGNEEIVWEAGRYHPLEVGPDPGKSNPATQQQRETLMAVSRCSGFFDYRALLRASLSQTVDALPEQLFLLFVENLLGGFRARVGGRERYVGELWSELKKEKPKSRRESHIGIANSVAKRFNDAFRPFLAQVTKKANEYLPYFPNSKMKIDFDYPGSSFAKLTKLLTGKAINPVIEFNGKKVSSHHEFLNEARLTALALSVFLAAVKLADSDPSNAEPLRLLALDDVLIGLDLNNRLPLLELLRIEFPQHQIVLLTHDLVWFEIAREHTAHWGDWRSARLFEDSTGPTEASLPRLKTEADDLDFASSHLNAHDLRAAAVYVRAAFESWLKQTATSHQIQVPYDPRPEKLTADPLWTRILRRHATLKKAGKGEFLDPNLIPRISAVRSNVLNRLSHSGSSSLTQVELEVALDTIKAIRASPLPFHVT